MLGGGEKSVSCYGKVGFRYQRTLSIQSKSGRLLQIQRDSKYLPTSKGGFVLSMDPTVADSERGKKTKNFQNCELNMMWRRAHLYICIYIVFVCVCVCVCVNNYKYIHAYAQAYIQSMTQPSGLLLRAPLV